MQRLFYLLQRAKPARQMSSPARAAMVNVFHLPGCVIRARIAEMVAMRHRAVRHQNLI